MPWNPNQEDNTDNLIGQLDCVITKIESKKNTNGNRFLWITFKACDSDTKTRAQFYLSGGALKRLAAVYRACGMADTIVDDPNSAEEHFGNLRDRELRVWWYVDPDNAQYTIPVGVGPAGADCPANLDWNGITKASAQVPAAPVIVPNNDARDLDAIFGAAPPVDSTEAAIVGREPGSDDW